MKHDVYKFLGLVLAFILASCASENNKEDFKVIDPKEEIPVDFFEDKISDVTFSIIGENSGLPLSFPDRTLIIDSTLIIKFQNRSQVYFFDLEGNFKFLQKPTGQEALCFSEAYDIAIFDSDHILINDPSKKTIYKYDFKNRQIV